MHRYASEQKIYWSSSCCLSVLSVLASWLFCANSVGAIEGPTAPAGGSVSATGTPATLAGDCMDAPACVELVQNARKLSEAGQLKVALENYQSAYARWQSPWLLINIGRIQHKLGRSTEAIATYCTYLDSANSDTPERVEAARGFLQQAAKDLGPREPVSDTGPVRNGFIVAASLGVSLSLATTVSGIPQAGFALGWKQGRALFSVGVEFANRSLGSSGGGSASSSQSNSTFLIVPGLQVALVRSHDARVELLGATRFGFGAPIATDSSNPAPSGTSQFTFMYELGPGVRYWAHRHFAMNLLAGFRGDYQFDSMTDGTRSSTGTNGIFASIGGIGIF